MDSRQYSSFTDVLRGNINGEDELFGLSENNPLLVQDSPTDDEVATSKKKSTRGVAFSPEEDKLVVAAWLNTSVDPVHSNEQHKTTFYDKVAKYFKDHKTDSTRTKIEAKNESGTIAEMKIYNTNEMFEETNYIKKARELFKELYGNHFLYEHCWQMLKDFPKWASTVPREDSGKEMPQTLDSIDQGGGGGVGDTMDFKRPIGRKAEKANRKRKDDGKDVAAEYLKKKMKMLEESYAQEKERVRIKAEKELIVGLDMF
ncbi:glutathione s-transferase t3 [Quercus suber]|uniref:Glutathione s-transferase t3 n=1 Tax=Quercus suber TaxID=58331 RepID=A0AAW0LDB0_QUESU